MKFIENNFLVGVGVHTPDDGDELLVWDEVTLVLEEDLDVTMVDEAVVGGVDVVECLKNVPVMAAVQLLFQVELARVQLNFFLKKFSQ